MKRGIKMSADITAIILTKNEEVNIGDCIESIKKVVKRIVVIDSYSTDKTIEIAKKYGAEVYQHSFGLTKKTKVYQASTSELYGKVEEVPQRETTPFHPYSPYAVAKQYGFWIVKEYREAYGMFAVNGILFNHESERRGATSINIIFHFKRKKPSAL